MIRPDDGARTRDRAATEARLLAAVGEVIARDGLGGVGINAVARQAGVDKVLIYRYFDGLPGLLRAWGASGGFWPRIDDLIAADPALPSRPAAERFARFFAHFVAGLRARPLTLEILAAELTETNELTRILEAEREAWGEQAARVLGGEAFARRPELQTVTMLLVLGTQFLLLRARRTRIFGGLDVQGDAGWARIEADLAAFARGVFGDAG